MLTVLKLFKNVPKPTVIKRTFLSQAYYCNEVWDHRLNNPLLTKINLDDLYQELEQRFQKTGLISAVDVDLFANAINEDIYVDELMDLTHKLRVSAETSNMLNSTPHAVIRFLLNNDHKDELLKALDDRLNYGLFLDYYTGNLLMDKFYKNKDYTSGARIASQFMLQDETIHPLTKNLALLHCYNFILNPINWPTAPKIEEPEEEVKVRVRYLRNPYNDDHFDLVDGLKIVGKTIYAFTKGSDNAIEKSLQLLGLTLYDKPEQVAQLITNLQKSGDKIVKEIAELIPEGYKEEIEKLQMESADVLSFLNTQVKKAERDVAEKDVAAQCEVFQKWEEERLAAIERQKERLSIAERVENVTKTQKELKDQEERLWFFDREEEIELGIEAKKIYYPRRWFGKKKKPKKVDEGYIPPEV